MSGVASTAFHMRGSVLPAVLKRPTPYVMMLVNIGTMSAVKLGYFAADELHLHVHPHHAGMLTGLTTFFLVFYNANVFSRYNNLHHIMMEMSEVSLEVTSMIARSVENRNTMTRLVRMVLASMFLFYFGITPDTSPGSVSNISPAEWKMLQDLNLLQPAELQRLHASCLDAGATPSFPSFMLMHWCLKLLKGNCEPTQFNQVQTRIYLLRRSQAQVFGLLECPMPFQYVHLVNFTLFITLLTLAYAMGLADSYLSPVLFFIVQLVFFGMRELSQSLSDPFGIDELDFPVSRWLTSIFNMCVSVMNDVWTDDGSQALPLKLVDPGKSITDMLVESQQPQACLQPNILWTPSPNGNQYRGDYQRLPTEDVPHGI